MKRFLLFAGEAFEASGGWHDLQGSFDTLDETKANVPEQYRDMTLAWWHVVDTQTGEVVERGDDFVTSPPESSDNGAMVRAQLPDGRIVAGRLVASDHLEGEEGKDMPMWHIEVQGGSLIKWADAVGWHALRSPK